MGDALQHTIVLVHCAPVLAHVTGEAVTAAKSCRSIRTSLVSAIDVSVPRAGGLGEEIGVRSSGWPASLGPLTLSDSRGCVTVSLFRRCGAMQRLHRGSQLVHMTQLGIYFGLS